MAEQNGLHLWAGERLVRNPETYRGGYMYIAGTEVNLKHNALEIYISGCKKHDCKGCHNPELWAFDVGKPVHEVIEDILKKALVGKQQGLLDYIWVLGGEPMDHDEDLVELLRLLRLTDLKIVLWTHYTFFNDTPPFKGLIDYVKYGKYIPGGESYTDPILGIELANPEQGIMEVPKNTDPFKDLPYGIMPINIDPVLFLAYHDNPNLLLHNNKSDLYHFAIKLFDRWGGFDFIKNGILFHIENHPDLCKVLDIYPNQQGLKWLQYNVVHASNWDDFLAGKWPLYEFRGGYYTACTRR